MKTVIDLRPAYQASFLACLKVHDRDPELMAHKARWCLRMQDRGLSVKLALNEEGEAVGMVQVVPIAESTASGEGLAFIQCIWVNNYDEGVGQMQGQGYGKALLAAVEADARTAGLRGVAAWGMDFPQWFPVSWYESQGYTRADQRGPEVLVWKPFTDGAGMPMSAPRWIPWKKAPQPVPGKVLVTVFVHGWCPIGAANARVAHEAVRALTGNGHGDPVARDAVVLWEIDTSDRATYLEWGIDQGVWIDDEPFRPYGPPFTADELRAAIAARIQATQGGQGTT